ncbi:hypothetical protein [Nonomuraea salmonea]|uniref:hypothetical protein n=1 Tax=Nonomuraea salmonea TaxID=46181 RepID=UPI0031E81555
MGGVDEGRAAGHQVQERLVPGGVLDRAAPPRREAALLAGRLSVLPELRMPIEVVVERPVVDVQFAGGVGEGRAAGHQVQERLVPGGVPARWHQ